MPRIDGYEHRTGAHCGSSSLRNLSTVHRWGFDEPTCFGLASGLGFTYLDLPDSPHRGFFGRPTWMERSFFDHLGIEYEFRENDAWSDVRGDLAAQIDRDRPVMVFTDIYDLDYFGTDTHFAPHSLLVVGLEDGDVLLADSEFDEIQRLPEERLEAAMQSTFVVPLANRRLFPTDPEMGRSFEEATRAAIAETARYHLDPDSSPRDLGPGTHGLDGIRAFARELPEYDTFPDADWTIRFAYQNVEKRGTGGGAFRRLYASFLEGAADRIRIPADAPESMAGIADDWTDVGATLKAASERSDRRELLTEASEEVLDLADREQRLFERLRTAV